MGAGKEGGREGSQKWKHIVPFGELKFAFKVPILSHSKLLNWYLLGWYGDYTFVNLGKQILKSSCIIVISGT